MVTVRNLKTGRRAQRDSLDVQQARSWAAIYRDAQRAPGGMLCLNPDDQPEEQTWLDGNSPEYLISMLEHFAKYGTFVWQDEIGLNDFINREHAMRRLAEVRQERKQKPMARDSERGLPSPVEQVAEEMNLGKRTFERLLGKSAK
jgi:hypothetical protein